MNECLSPTKDQVAAAIRLLLAIAEVIKDCGKDGCPEGVLYSTICDKVELSDFQMMIAKLMDTGLFSRTNHIITYVGP